MENSFNWHQNKNKNISPGNKVCYYKFPSNRKMQKVSFLKALCPRQTLEMLGSKNRSSISGHSSQAWLCITRTQRPCESTSGPAAHRVGLSCSTVAPYTLHFQRVPQRPALEYFPWREEASAYLLLSLQGLPFEGQYFSPVPPLLVTISAWNMVGPNRNVPWIQLHRRF